MPGLCKKPLRRRVPAPSGSPLSSLPLESVLRVPVSAGHQERWGEHIDWMIVDQGHPGYPAGCTTLMTKQVIQFLPYDANEPDNPIAMRGIMGNNRYLHSNIRQFLDSTAPAGQWYAALHAYDTPPSLQYVDNGQNPYDHLSGFLTLFPQGFTGSMLATQLTALQCEADGGGADQMEDKVFLPSAAEVGGTGEAKFAVEGSAFPVFSPDNESRLAYPTAEALASSEIDNPVITVDQPCFYSLRTPFLTDMMPGCIYTVMVDGSLMEYAGAVYVERAIRPVCNLPGSMAVLQPEGESYYVLA